MSNPGQIPRDDQWFPADVQRELTDIFHVSLGVITPYIWTTAIAKLIHGEGAEATLRSAVRSFNERVESIGQFQEAIDEDEYVVRFSSKPDQSPTGLAKALLNDLLPRAKKWSS